MPKQQSQANNVKLLARSLTRRQHNLRQLWAQSGDGADRLWLIWQDAVQFASLAKQFWPDGRDAGLSLLRTERRDEGINRINNVLNTLQKFGIHDATHRVRKVRLTLWGAV